MHDAAKENNKLATRNTPQVDVSAKWIKLVVIVKVLTSTTFEINVNASTLCYAMTLQTFGRFGQCLRTIYFN